MREMKDSGIEWIGSIPKDWKFSKIDRLYELRNIRVSDKDYSPLSVTMKGILPQLENVAKTNDGDNRKLVCKGDFAINSRSDRRGSCGISEFDGSVSLINIVLKPKTKMNNKFYNWLFHTNQFADEFYSCGHGIVNDLWTTTWQNMKKIDIPSPNIEKQKKIANYLDKKCTEIDKIKDDIEKQITILENYKKSIITETVTKGLNPDIEMKDSGVDWIGKIPKHWQVHPIYNYFTERKDINLKGEETNLLSLSYGKIIRKNINNNFGLLPENFNGYNIIEKNDIVMRLTDLQNDKRSLRVGLCEERGIITSAYITIKKVKDIDIKYFYYLLYSYDTNKVLYNMGNGIRQSLNYNELKNLLLIEPLLKEQEEIANYLDKKCAEIDNIIESKRKQLSIIEEYKKSLIYEYVTGKREVV